MTQRSIQELTQAIASGDTEAFACFYDEWFERVYADARRTTGRDEAFCLDLVQDVMMRAIQKLPPLTHESALYAWLRTTMRRCALDQLRSDRRRLHREAAAHSIDHHTERLHDLDDRIAWLEQELGDMSTLDRELLTMRHRFRWTLSRIGSALGLSTSAVDGRLSRLTRQLKERAPEEMKDECNA